MPAGQDVVFRGSKEGLEIVLGDVQDFGALKDKLKEQLKRAESFFQVSDVVLDTGDATLSLDEILEIQNMLAYPYGLRLKKIVHGSRAGAGKDRGRRDAAARPALSPPAPVEARGQSGSTASSPPPRAFYGRGAQNAARFPAGSARLPETLLHKGTLRSGQRIDYDGNVVVLGDVNPGAEVRASGDIVVMGALRGLAHAGSEGGPGAVVAFRLEPTQLRIGDVIGRPPEGEAKSGREPEVAKLKNGVILIEPLEGAKWEGER